MDSFGVREELNGKFAIYDIGSNTLLLTIVECNNGIIKILEDHIEIARLGEGLAQSGKIAEESLERARKIISRYKEIIGRYEIEQVIPMATAAVREASNSAHITSILADIIGHDISVLPSESEAVLSYYGTFGTRESGTIIDIGGGSTEFAFIEDSRTGGKAMSNISIPIGAVKIKEMFLYSDPAKPDEIEKARRYIQQKFKDFNLSKGIVNLNAVAGTPVTIASIELMIPGYDFNKIHGHKISNIRLDEIMDKIVVMKADELRDILHVHPHRSDIIVAGALILQEYVKYCNLKEFTVNCLGLRFGPLAIPKNTSEYKMLFN